MKGVIAREPGTEVIFTDMTEPVPGEYDTLVRLDACGICNSTDYKLAKNTFVSGSFPIALGHESIGTVVETGKKVKHFKPGDRVFRQVLPAILESDGLRSVWGGFAELGLVTDEWARQDIPYGPEHYPGAQQKLLIDIEPARGDHDHPDGNAGLRRQHLSCQAGSVGSHRRYRSGRPGLCAVCPLTGRGLGACVRAYEQSAGPVSADRQVR